ncbi:MAG: hypothetical protein MI919_16820, partial [Holophagales bacterium]|nr:hypothetical protein [Holophagales bacterium]
KTVQPKPTPPTRGDRNELAFWRNLYERTLDHDRRVEGQLSGNLPLRPVSVLDMDLDNDVLVHQQEYLLFDPYQAKTPLSQIRARMRGSGTALQIEHSGQAITDNNLAGGSSPLAETDKARPVQGRDFVTVGISENQSIAIHGALTAAGILDGSGEVQAEKMASLDLYSVLQGLTKYDTFGPDQYPWVQEVLLTHMEATALFRQVEGRKASVTPVKNQPGSFLFRASGETFLLTPRPVKEGEPVFSTLTEGLEVGPPRITPMSFLMKYEGRTPGSIDAQVSAEILEALYKYKVIQDGRITASTTFENVKTALAPLVKIKKKITEDQVGYIYNALVNAPRVFDDAFIAEKIDSSLSGKIYATLQNHSIVDPNGRIVAGALSGSNVALALGNLLLAGELSRRQVSDIYQVLEAIEANLDALEIPYGAYGINLVDTSTDPPAVRFMNKTSEGEWRI